MLLSISPTWICWTWTCRLWWWFPCHWAGLGLGTVRTTKTHIVTSFTHYGRPRQKHKLLKKQLLRILETPSLRVDVLRSRIVTVLIWGWDDLAGKPARATPHIGNGLVEERRLSNASAMILNIREVIVQIAKVVVVTEKRRKSQYFLKVETGIENLWNRNSVLRTKFTDPFYIV